MKIRDMNGLLEEQSMDDVLDNMLEELEVNATEDRDAKELEVDIDNEDVYGDDEESAEDVEGVVVKENQLANGPELERAGELNNEATLERAPKTLAPDIDNEDVYGDDEESAEDVEGVVVTEKMSIKNSLSDYELLSILDENGYEPSIENLKLLKEEIDAGNIVIEDTLETDPSVEEAKDEFGENPPSAEVGKVSENTEDDMFEDKNGDSNDNLKEDGLARLFSLIDSINESVTQHANGPELSGSEELENEATKKGEDNIKNPDKNNSDIYPSEEHKQSEDVKGLVIKENQLANGPELERANELNNEATLERAPKVNSLSKTNNDVYTADNHKQVEDVVGVVVEAAALCKSHGIPATLDNLTEAVKEIIDECGKNFCIDSWINSKAVTGTKKTEKGNTNPTTKDLNGLSGKDASCLTATDLKESVNYTSIREACLLDENYFDVDTYSVQTSAEKKSKLNEQLSLLLAREANDSLYEELLKESIHAHRLQEAIVKKYGEEAAVRAESIYNKN